MQTNRNIINQIISAIKDFLPKKNSSILGSKVPIINSLSTKDYYGTNLSRTDYQEIPIRGGSDARILIEIVNKSVEAKTALAMTANNVFAGSSGDDGGLELVPKESAESQTKTPLRPVVKKIGNEVLDKISRTLYTSIVRNMLGYGDSFVELGFDETGICEAILLPTWEVERIEDVNGYLVGFRQIIHHQYYQKNIDFSNSLGDKQNKKEILFAPAKILHFRWEPRFMYGESLFSSCIDDWLRLNERQIDVDEATRSCAINPFIHTFPEYAENDYKRLYKEGIAAKRRDRIITDLFVDQGVEVRRVPGVDPKLDSLIEERDKKVRKIAVASRVPPYLLGIESMKSREISLHPATEMERFIRSVQSVVAEHFRSMVNLQLAIYGIDYTLPENSYELRFPRFSIASGGSARKLIADDKIDEFNTVSGVI